jgi:pimeloyl-ACP methyl ester carboxylesterase
MRDLLVPSHNTREMAQVLPSMRQVLIPAPHWVLQTEPEASATAILNFMSQNLEVQERP